MRPKIMTCRSIDDSFRYNEEKVELEKAECILAQNFLKDAGLLTKADKLSLFERRMELNSRACTSLHITLNFDPLDKLTDAKMQDIARVYMKEIGFERQPYLVYRHHDSGHPHCHIVTTHVKEDGSLIDLYNIGRHQSERARMRIEKEFNLMTAEQKERQRLDRKIGKENDYLGKREGVQMVRYGEEPTAAALSRVLEYITANFKCSSLEEFNAILRLYRVEACRGSASSKPYQNRGLLYRALDAEGKRVGVPLKASFFDCKPTLDRLEQNFRLQHTQKQQHLSNVETWVRRRMLLAPDDLKELGRSLVGDNIRMVLKMDKAGKCKEVYYIDFWKNCVFSGDELGAIGNKEAIQRVIDNQALREQLSKDLREEETLQKRHHRSHRLSL